MTTKQKIKSHALKLGLGEVAKGKFSLNADEAAIKFVEKMFEYGLLIRKERSIARNLKASSLPNVEFDITKLNDGLQYQVGQLEKFDWLEKNNNLLIAGACGIGKTVLASSLAKQAIENGFKSMYIKQDELLMLLDNKDLTAKAKQAMAKLESVDLIVLDEFLYLNLPNEVLLKLYQLIMRLNNKASLLFVSNREPSEWLEGAEDKYTMKLLVDRALVNSKVFRWSSRKA